MVLNAARIATWAKTALCAALVACSAPQATPPARVEFSNPSRRAELPAIPLFPGPQWYEYSTKNFTGFPGADDPYAVGSTYALERLLVLTKVQPK